MIGLYSSKVKDNPIFGGESTPMPTHTDRKNSKGDRQKKSGRKRQTKGGKGGKRLVDGTDHKKMGPLEVNNGPSFMDQDDPNYVPPNELVPPPAPEPTKTPAPASA